MTFKTFIYIAVLIALGFLGLLFVLSATKPSQNPIEVKPTVIVPSSAPQTNYQPKPQIKIEPVKPVEPPNVRCQTRYFLGREEVVCQRSWL